MQIAKHTVVSLSYDLHIDENNTKVLADSANEEQPLSFLFGVGMMIPMFEEKLDGLKEGETFNFTVPASEGYGDYIDEDIIDLPIDTFKIDGEIDQEMLQVGNFVPLMDNHGHQLHAKVLEVSSDLVKVDLNHPLAGQDLHFNGKILNIRLATAEELDHGHVHGEGGHHHDH